jgi:hypothetical protein
MIEVPPSHALVMNEVPADQLTPARIRKLFRDKGFIHDLADQCSASLQAFPYVDCLDAPGNEPDAFNIYAAGGLTPFDSYGCENPHCKVAYVDHFARIAGLYGTTITVADKFTWIAPELPADEALTAVSILWRLRPMVEAGIVRYSRPAYSQCSACSRVMKRAKTRIAKLLWQELEETCDVFMFRLGPQARLSFGCPLLYVDDQPYRITVLAPKEVRRHFRPHQVIRGEEASQWLREFAEVVKFDLETIASNLVFDVRMAMITGSVLATSSRLAAAAFRNLDGRNFEIGNDARVGKHSKFEVARICVVDCGPTPGTARAGHEGVTGVQGPLAKKSVFPHVGR